MCRLCIGSALVTTILWPLVSSSPAAAAPPVARPRMTILEPAAAEDPAGLPEPQPKRPPVRDAGQAERGPATRPGVPHVDDGRPRPSVGAALDAGIAWLVSAQAADGGWGSGDGRPPVLPGGDPRAMRSDPAITAFAAGALLRAGHTPLDGACAPQVRKATEMLCSIVEAAGEAGSKITDRGSQIQTKLGPLVDTAATARYLASALPHIPPEHALHRRVAAALDKCVSKLERGQQPDGSWGRKDGWAPVAQSALACSALEFAQAAGRKRNWAALEKARDHLKRNVNATTGRVDAREASGVPLYAFAGAQRASAAEARVAHAVIARAKADDKVGSDAVPDEKTLLISGVPAKAARRLAAAAALTARLESRVGDEKLLRGFGNDGGEEFLSFCLIGEAFTITGAAVGEEWHRAMADRLAAVQNADGSWSGHHCITSAAFCTAAAVQCLTVHDDSRMLGEVVSQAIEQAVGDH